MSFFSKLFGRKTAETETKVGGMEDFMTLIRVYLQASIAAQVGISNLAVLPDLRVFKQTLKVPTVNNKLGVGEKKRCAKMLNEIYHVSETFPTEIDTSVKKRCKKLQDVQPYMLPAFMRSALKTMTEKTVHDLLTKNDWKDENVRRTVAQIRLYQEKLGFSESWMSEYVYTTVMLAKKEKRPNIEEDK